MIRDTTRKVFLGLTFVFTVLLVACGGGGDGEEMQWPQPVGFTDFTERKDYFSIASYSNQGLGITNCLTCINLFGIGRSNTELGNLLKDFFNTPPSWPAPYSDKPYSALPIDYSSKMAVVLEDKGSKFGYQYTVQKVEESANAVTISVLKCVAFLDLYGLPSTIYLGVLLPKTNKPIQVLTLQSGKPTLPEYLPNGLGAC